jgi:hypothetical protein
MSEVINFAVSEGVWETVVETPLLQISAKLLKARASFFLKLSISCNNGGVRLVEIVSDDTAQLERRMVDTKLSRSLPNHRGSMFSGLASCEGVDSDVFERYCLFVRLSPRSQDAKSVRGQVHYERLSA